MKCAVLVNAMIYINCHGNQFVHCLSRLPIKQTVRNDIQICSSVGENDHSYIFI